MRRRTALKAAAVLPFVPAGAVVATAQPSNAAESGIRLAAAGDMNRRDRAHETGKLAVAHDPKIVCTLGDQQYPSGTLEEYRNGFDRTPWGQILKPRIKPVPGHHEYETPGAAGYFAYFDVPSFYAYSIGNGWRGYALNSHTRIAEQHNWVKQDLAANPGKNVVVSYSDPRWSSGTKHGNERDMEPLWTAFAGRKGIILNGHEHHYERFAVKDGMRQFVVGTGGSATYPFGTPIAWSQKRISLVPGVLLLWLRSGGSYSWQFRAVGGTVRDSGSDVA